VTALKKSPWVYYIALASCNGCSLEVLAAISPLLDPERFGIRVVESPKHADVLLVSGLVNPKIRETLLTVYRQMPEPKKVIVLGSCSISNGVFTGSYNALEPVNKHIPVDMYIPGCPPRPQAIFHGIARVLGEQL